MATKGNQRQAGVGKLAKLIKGIRFAMLTTAEGDGSLRSRPMATQKGAFDGTLWFFTRESSHKVEDIRREKHVNLAYADPEKQMYVSVSGKARVVKDKGKMKALWNPAYRIWFPEGLKDPDMALLRVDVTEAEYWDSPKGAMVYLIGVAKAHKKGDLGENVKVRVWRGRPGRAEWGPSLEDEPGKKRTRTWQ